MTSSQYHSSINCSKDRLLIHSSEQLKKSKRLRSATASAVSLQVAGSSGLSVPLMPGATVSPFELADASRVMEDEVNPTTLNDRHVPFADLSYLSVKHPLKPEASRRLREDFIRYYAVASDKLKAMISSNNSKAEAFTELLNYFFKHLQDADVEDTVISGG